MPLSQAAKQVLVNRIRRAIDRARSLYDRMVVNGMTRNHAGTPVHLRQVDRRDAAQFIFFELAAKFESFLVDAFAMEARIKFDVQPQRAEYIVGHIDRGLDGVMGWAVPRNIRDRARHLHGVSGFFARLDSLLGSTTYQRLHHAHVVRNRIAHASGSAVSQYRQILGALQVPGASRQGLSPGRLLVEYPSATAVGDRWFHRFVSAYTQCVDSFNRSVRVS